MTVFTIALLCFRQGLIVTILDKLKPIKGLLRSLILMSLSIMQRLSVKE